MKVKPFGAIQKFLKKPYYVFEVLDVGFVSFCFRRDTDVSSVLNLRSSSC